MKKCLTLDSTGVKSDDGKIKFFTEALKENKIDGSYIKNGSEYELNCISTESCKNCDFEEHCYFGIRKLTRHQFFMLADKFNEIKKVSAPDIKFGTVVKLQTRQLKIKEDKLRDLRINYGKCLSERQIKQIQEELYENENFDNDYLTINYEDLETTNNRIITGIISGISSPFGYYFNEYSQHSNIFIGSNTHCVQFVHKPEFILDKPGKDFEDYFTWTIPEIIEIIPSEESQKYLEKQKDFYSLI
jgi:hypothetical protein